MWLSLDANDNDPRRFFSYLVAALHKLDIRPTRTLSQLETPRLPQADDLTTFVEAFGSTNRYILDYLFEEVLNQQEPAIQGFLMDTSILERMCGALCDDVRFGEAVTRDSQAILAQRERSNLFVMPLDDERRWYRYHHLLADLLQSTLGQCRSAEQIRELHRRAIPALSRSRSSDGSIFLGGGRSVHFCPRLSTGARWMLANLVRPLQRNP